MRLFENLKTCETEIKSNIIGQYIMEALMHLDQVAYVRFASVYKTLEKQRF